MDPKLPTPQHPDAARLAHAEARLLARLPHFDASEASGSGETLGHMPLSPAEVQWRGPQASWEAATPGDEVGRRYRFGEVFARGGLGTVRRAEDRKLGRPVAIKELLRLDEASVQRFVREAEITARLQHPGIVPLHDLGRDADGRPFLCMKLVDGDTLEMAIAASPDLPARLALLPHLIATADAIAYAHRHGVIHRDLKPANILVGEFGETVVIDWGLAKDLSQATQSDPGMTPVPDTISDLTAAGSLLGTLRYMAPEQARGEPVDARSDVYALGASLFHLLAGVPPFSGRGPAALLLTHVLAGTPGPLPAASPRALVAIVEKAMALAPADRYPGADALADDLRRFTAGGLVGAHDYSLTEVGKLWFRRHRSASVIAAASLLALVAVGGASMVRISAARADAVAGQQDALAAGELAEQRAVAAEQARDAADRATDQLRLAQARSALNDDPPATIGWLAQLGDTESHDDAAQTLALAARAHGLPTRTLRGPQRPLEYAMSLADGTIVGSEEEGPLWRWRPGELVGEQLGPTGQLVSSTDGTHWAVARKGEIEVHRAGQAPRRVALRGRPDDVYFGPRLRADGLALIGELRSAGQTMEVDLDTGEVTPLLGPPAFAAVKRWTVANDGQRIAGVHGETLLVYDRVSGELHTQALPGPVTNYPLRFSSDGETVMIALAGEPGPYGITLPRQFALWRAGAPFRVVTANASALIGDTVIFSGKTATGLRVWAEDLRTGAVHWSRTLATSTHDRVSLPTSPDGRLLWILYGDDDSAMLDAETGVMLPTPQNHHIWLAHAGTVMIREGAALRVYDLLHAPWQTRVAALPGGALATALAPGAGMMARQRASDGAIERIDVARGSVESMPAGCGAWTGKPDLGLAIADDGRVLVTGASLCLWDAQGARETALTGFVTDVSFTPDGVRLILDSGADNLLEWRGTEATPRPLGHTGPAAASVAVDGGRALAVVSAKGGVRLFGAGPSRELLPDDEQRWSQAGLAIAPDQRTLAVYRRGASELQLVDVIDGSVSTLANTASDGPRDPSPRLRFDASGQHLALLDGGRLTRWSRARPEAPVSIEVPGGIGIGFTADPRRLAVQTRDGELLLVDPEAGLGVPLRPRSSDTGFTTTLGQDLGGGVLLLTPAGELKRWRDELPGGAAIHGWLDQAALQLGVAR